MIIDEKGRLFGIINVFDLFVLVLLLIGIYLGVAALIAVRQTPLEIVSITPDQVMSGQGAEIGLQIKNRKVTKSGRVRLIPADFQGETLQLEVYTNYGIRDNVKFKLSPDVRPGRYRVELELLTQDSFRRNSIVLAQPEDKFLKLEQAEDKYWQLLGEAAVPAAAATRLDPQVEYRDSTGMFSARIEESEPETNKSSRELLPGAIPTGEIRLVKFRFYVPFTGLPDFQTRYLGAGSRFVLETQEGWIPAWMTGRGELKPELARDRILWEMDLLLLVFSAEQRAAVKAGARQTDDRDEVLAEVLQVLGEEPTGWISTAPESGQTPVNLRVRMRLMCSLKDGRLQWQGQSLAPQSMLKFNFGGQEISGNLVEDKAGAHTIRVNLIFPVLTSFAEKLIRPGAYLLDPASRRPVGQIAGIIESAPAEIPEAFLADREVAGLFGRQYRQVLVSAALECVLRENGLYVGSQILAKNTNLIFNLFSEQFQVRLSDNGKLPSRAEAVIVKADVKFTSIDPLIAEMLKPGAQDIGNMDSPDIELESMVSNSPAKVLLTGETRITVAEHPVLRDVQARVKLKAIRRGEQYFFRGAPLLIGSTFSMRFSKFNVNGTVMGF